MVNFYGKDLPDTGDLVVCRIDRIIENAGYLVALLEYDDREGYVGLKEITQAKWLRNLKSLVQLNDIEVMQVTVVDSDGSIDLSRKYINEELKEKALLRYKYWKRIYDYLDFMATPDTKQTITFQVLHPFIRESKDTDTENDSQKREISTWTSTKGIIFEDDNICVIFQNVVKLIEKPVEKEFQSEIIQLKNLLRIKVTIVNSRIQLLSEKYRVTIRSHNSKNAEYQITSQEKITSDEFTNLMERLISHKFDEKKDSQIITERTDLPVVTERQTEQPIMNIGMVGHVAHGKTTLIEALTGVDTRKHKKEIASNRTLKIGYTNATIVKCQCNEEVGVYLALKDSSATCKCPRVTISIVDCPGHNVLLSTMITGAQIFDTCILVVSADETIPMPQTWEHVAVLEITAQKYHENHGLRKGLVIHNKADLLQKDAIYKSKKQLEDFVKGTIFEDRSIIPTSAQLKLNTEYILKFMYESAKGMASRKDDKESGAYGLVVRTFDINKPGSSEIHGLVIGGSILKGLVSVGDDLVLLPHNIETKIYSLKTERTLLQVSGTGGLVAMQTDINPSFCDSLIGCSFVKKSHFVPECLIAGNTELKFKYTLLKDAKVDLSKGMEVIINMHGWNTQCKINRIVKDKCKGTLTLGRPVYLFPDTKNQFTILWNKRLIGFGRFEKLSVGGSGTVHSSIDYSIDSTDSITETYDELYSLFLTKLEAWKKAANQRLHVPPPQTVYMNTFTTISNFSAICDSIGVKPEILADYIHSELGAKSKSLNASKQLILKGRTDEKKVTSVIQNYLIERRCPLCKQNTITTIKNMGVRQKLCTNCSWKGIADKK